MTILKHVFVKAKVKVNANLFKKFKNLRRLKQVSQTRPQILENDKATQI